MSQSFNQSKDAVKAAENGAAMRVAQRELGSSVSDKKPECPACGHDDYEGELIQCPHCGGKKCSFCDMGDDVGCVVCDND